MNWCIGPLAAFRHIVPVTFNLNRTEKDSKEKESGKREEKEKYRETRTKKHSTALERGSNQEYGERAM